MCPYNILCVFVYRGRHKYKNMCVGVRKLGARIVFLLLECVINVCGGGHIPYPGFVASLCVLPFGEAGKKRGSEKGGIMHQGHVYPDVIASRLPDTIFRALSAYSGSSGRRWYLSCRQHLLVAADAGRRGGGGLYSFR